MIERKIILIGYSGHAYVVHNIFESNGQNTFAYCDAVEKEFNPFKLIYLGTETSKEGLDSLSENNFFISIGDNKIRCKIYSALENKKLLPTNAIHASSTICKSSFIHSNGVMIGAQVIINPLSKIGKGTICNTGCVIEHECIVGDFAHIGPGAILCGNVQIGENSFVGAGAVIRQGIKIGKNVTIGAGSVVVKDVENNSIVKGVPAKPFNL
jgi:sugar O-acyltransferase (sialic acid O-acetyltransferase NeuD family)